MPTQSAKSYSSTLARLLALLTGHAALLVLFMVFVAWYLADAWTASSKTANLVLILPASIAAFTFGAVIVFQEVKARPGADRPQEVESGTFPMILLIAAYVGAIVLLGFAASTMLFLFGASWLLGMRRPVHLLLFPVLFTIIIIVGLDAAVLLPQPLLLEWLGVGL